MAEMRERPTQLPKWCDPRLIRAPSAIHGVGVHTTAPIRAGELVMRWGGTLIDAAEYDPAVHRPRATTCYDATRFLTSFWSEPETVDEALNHSCDPNCGMLDEVSVVTLRELHAGEELTTDMAMWSDDPIVYAEVCRCGTALCRGRLTGLDWQLPALQERYRGRFLPHLNRRIAGR
jgi:uncharacterized protein